MTEFKAFWQNYTNFSDRTTRRGYWMSYLFLIITSMVVGFIGGLMGTTVGMVITVIFSLAIVIPSLAIQVRRLRDAGKRWTWIFINFVPLIGWIWYLILLCTPSVPDDGTPVV